MNRKQRRTEEKAAKKSGTKSVTIAPAQQSLNIQQSLNLAINHHTEGRLPEAEKLYKQILEIDPNQHVAMHLLGVIAHQVGNNDIAVVLISRALEINPLFDEAHNNLGIVLHSLGKIDEAIASYHKSLATNPLYIKAYINLGNALYGLGKTDEAIASYHKAIAIDPDYVDAHNNLGKTYQDLGEMELAIACFRKALAINPDLAIAHSSLIFTQDYIPTINQAEQQIERRLWNEQFIRPLAKNIKPHSNNMDPDRRLRIGYVSADFCNHSAFQGFAPLILDHDTRNFDVICYDATMAHDQVSVALHAAATDWRTVGGINDDVLAQTIRDDAIDILVDLSSHTLGNRLKAFGYKPAPLQVTGIGHLSPGISTIDYRLTTGLITPPEEENLYPEKPIYLNTYFGFTPPPDVSPVGPPPCLENGFITFGFLGRFNKVSDEVLELWARILLDVSQARLLLKFRELDNPTTRQKIKDAFSRFGIPEDRLILLGRTDQHEHLNVHNRVDIILDTIPHGGGITTMESLWMGVPVIGLLNPNKAGGRIIESICQPLGLEQWVARSHEQYHAIAVEKAKSKNELTIIKRGLRQQVSDVYSHFHKDIEKSYRLIWKRWCNGEATTTLDPRNNKLMT